MSIAKMIKKIGNIITGGYRFLFCESQDFVSERLDICNNCEHKVFLDEFAVCNKCWCVIQCKAEVKDETCLDGRWPNVK